MSEPDLVRFLDFYVRSWPDTSQMRHVADWIEQHGDPQSQIVVDALREHADVQDAENEEAGP
jgi:hypothetical protein